MSAAYIRSRALYRRRTPRLVAPAKRKRYVTPHTKPRGSQATGAHLPVEIIQKILGGPYTREEFVIILSKKHTASWKDGIWVASKGERTNMIAFPRAEGRYLLRNVLGWKEVSGKFETWYSPKYSDFSSGHYSGASELEALSDYLDKLEEKVNDGGLAAIIKQDTNRPYLWHVSRPTGGSARVFSYIKPSELTSLLQHRFVYIDISEGAKRKYKIYGE